MKITPRLICMAVILVISATPLLPAQHAGFQIGIAQPALAFPPTYPPAIAMRGTFVASPFPVAAAPIVIIQNQFVTSNPVFIPNQVFTPNPVFVVSPGFTAGNPVFFPSPVFNTAPGFIPNQFFLPGQVFPTTWIPGQVIVPDHVLVPGQTIIPGAAGIPVGLPPVSTFGPPVRDQVTLPIPGTARAEVLRQFGQPTVTITTRTGETLHFYGGVTITLQNGQVTGPR